MFCKNCGKEIIEGNRFCVYCGTRVPTAEELDCKPEPIKSEAPVFSAPVIETPGFGVSEKEIPVITAPESDITKGEESKPQPIHRAGQPARRAGQPSRGVAPEKSKLSPQNAYEEPKKESVSELIPQEPASVFQPETENVIPQAPIKPQVPVQPQAFPQPQVYVQPQAPVRPQTPLQPQQAFAVSSLSQSVENQGKKEKSPKKEKSKGGIVKALIALLVIAGLAVGGYFAYPYVSDVLSDVFSGGDADTSSDEDENTTDEEVTEAEPIIAVTVSEAHQKDLDEIVILLQNVAKAINTNDKELLTSLIAPDFREDQVDSMIYDFLKGYWDRNFLEEYGPMKVNIQELEFMSDDPEELSSCIPAFYHEAGITMTDVADGTFFDESTGLCPEVRLVKCEGKWCLFLIE